MTPDHVANGDGVHDVRQHLIDDRVAQVGVQQTGKTPDAQVETEESRVVE